MAKGYWIGRVDVHNDDGYKPYAAANPAIFKKFGGRFVVRAGKFEEPEGSARVAQRRASNFPIMPRRSPVIVRRNIRRKIKVRQPHAVLDIIIIEGYDGPQP